MFKKIFQVYEHGKLKLLESRLVTHDKGRNPVVSIMKIQRFVLSDESFVVEIDFDTIENELSKFLNRGSISTVAVAVETHNRTSKRIQRCFESCFLKLS